MAAGQGKGTESFLPREVHEIEVTSLSLVDLTTATALASVELGANDIASPDWSRCQEIGQTAHYLGTQGIIAPSATGSGIVIAVFAVTLSDGQLILASSRSLEPDFD